MYSKLPSTIQNEDGDTVYRALTVYTLDDDDPYCIPTSMVDCVVNTDTIDGGIPDCGMFLDECMFMCLKPNGCWDR